MPDPRPDILYVLSHGFAGRMVLHSELLTELGARGVRVAVLAPNADKDYFKALCARRGVEPILAPEVGGFVYGHYGQSRRYLFEDYENNAALRAKHLWDVSRKGKHRILKLRSQLGKAVNGVLLRTPPIPRLLSEAEQHLLRSLTLRRLLQRVRPRVVVSTYPVAWLEALTILEARRLGIPTLGQLLSWDNITCKGRFAAVPDRFISWGPIMTSELGEFYGAKGDAVLEAGVAHFDLHTRPVERDVLDGYLRRLGLDPGRPYLFVGMSAGFFAPHEVDIVSWLADRVRSGALGDIQLLVRPHPQNVRGPMADTEVIRKLHAMAGGPVVVDLPDVVSDELDMGENDMMRLVALLHGASVTLNSGSTLTIDSLIHDRPVILTLFDADAKRPWCESARRLGEFPHLKKLLSYGGVSTAASFAELEKLLLAYLRDPSLHRAERKRALEAECGVCDGHACVRIAEGLTRFLEASRR